MSPTTFAVLPTVLSHLLTPDTNGAHRAAS